MFSSKRIIFSFYLFIFIFSFYYTSVGQMYNNDWVNYNQTYYKIKVINEGWVRIPQSTLAAAGIGNVPVEQFQLWRNGKMVPINTSQTTGVLPSNGYIEFFGVKNDGEFDRNLYLNPEFHYTDKKSLLSDTSTYFLTYNDNNSGLIFEELPNDIASNTLPVTEWFYHTQFVSFQRMINSGTPEIIGEYVYSSSYDNGVMVSSINIQYNTGLTNRALSFTNLAYKKGVGTNKLKFVLLGASPTIKPVQLKIGNNEIYDVNLSNFNVVYDSISFDEDFVTSNTLQIAIENKSTVTTDRVRGSFMELEYPRSTDLTNASHFAFQLPASNDGYYFEFTNINTATFVPYLYDLTNAKKWAMNRAEVGKYKVVIPPSISSTDYVIVTGRTNLYTTITSLNPINFIDYSNISNQGDYIIVSNKKLFNGTNNLNPIEEYKSYRSSSLGGGYNAIVVDIEQIVDQYGYGIYMHPLALRNFIRYSIEKFSIKPKFFFLIGKGVSHASYYGNSNVNLVAQSVLVPTFGYPGSDNLLAATNLNRAIPEVPIGRLSAISAIEVENYLEKVKEYENAFRTAGQNLEERSWMKSVLHVTGSTSQFLGTQLCNYMTHYKDILEGPKFGAHVTSVCRTSVNPDLLSSELVTRKIGEGLGIISYFGHSSASTLEFSIEDPYYYNNSDGKYPVFFVNGCNAGNFFALETARDEVISTLSEKFVLAKQKGGIAFVASTHYGVVSFLNVYMNKVYNNIAASPVNLPVGKIVAEALDGMLDETGANSFLGRLHAEQITTHGDPAIKLLITPKPDYLVSENSLILNKANFTVADQNVHLKVKINNLGLALTDSLLVTLTRLHPDGTTSIILDEKIRPVFYEDSIDLLIPIIAVRDIGVNKLTLTVNRLNEIDEEDFNNNTVIKEFTVIENDIVPVYPYFYQIIGDAQQKIYASTADPLIGLVRYHFEIDTTTAFNSPLRYSTIVEKEGGLLEFDPPITYIDSVTYYWRVAIHNDDESLLKWNLSSFTYIPGEENGFGQSHYYQHLNSEYNRMELSGYNNFEFTEKENYVKLVTGVWGSASFYSGEFSVSINDNYYNREFCNNYGVVISVYNPVTLLPMRNGSSGQPGQFGSDNICKTMVENQFQFGFTPNDHAKRKLAADFLDLVPDGYYVVVMPVVSVNSTANYAFVDKWKEDTTLYGDQSLYKKLKYYGFEDLDEYSYERSWMFVFKKNDPTNFSPFSMFSNNKNDRVTYNGYWKSPAIDGKIESPKFGPAISWNKVIWEGDTKENPSQDSAVLQVIGLDTNNSEYVLFELPTTQKELDISSVNAESYPYIKLRMHTTDSLNATPYQLKYWRLYFTGVPELALAPNLLFEIKDTIDAGEPLWMKFAVRNISNSNFDSLKVRVTLLDESGGSSIIYLNKLKPIVAGDSASVNQILDYGSKSGLVTLLVEVNPDGEHLEHSLTNNFFFKEIYIKGDEVKPVVDVTFDGVRILNKDIVSAAPYIQIKVTDNSLYRLLQDTSVASILLKYPTGEIRNIYYNSDTLRFIPASSTEDNTAMVEFRPVFTSQRSADGDEYELIVKAKDASGNAASSFDYRIAFKVITKSMISNLLNYPNPFSTSTAFVFTITGSEVPKNFKIQILTVTGKIVREITREELGPLQIGRNITEYKWDGRDQFGQLLGNGVYLYRVVTSINGQALEKYKANGEQTDQFFNNGYGKMYIMR